MKDILVALDCQESMYRKKKGGNCAQGFFFLPHSPDIGNISQLKSEHFIIF